jgi:hypothetical protein
MTSAASSSVSSPDSGSVSGRVEVTETVRGGPCGLGSVALDPNHASNTWS